MDGSVTRFCAGACCQGQPARNQRRMDDEKTKVLHLPARNTPAMEHWKLHLPALPVLRQTPRRTIPISDQRVHELKTTCRRNPLMPAHEHRRENGSLVCVGYVPATKSEALKQALPNAKVETAQGRTDYEIWQSSRRGAKDSV